jgi:predicted dithiol-disulfide oxidoreductase (DUF899 family)
MTNQPIRGGSAIAGAPLPPVTDRSTFQAQMDVLRRWEKAHTREADAIAAARRSMPMVEVDAGLELIGPDGSCTLLEAFEGRRQLIAYYFMWNTGRPAPEQCEGCTWCNTHVAELAYLHSRDITYAVFCQGPYDESVRYHDFMGWTMPWYSALPSQAKLLEGRHVGRMHLVCYVRDGDRVFETYWTTLRGVEVMDNSMHLMDLTVYGRQMSHEKSPEGWPLADDNGDLRADGRPLAQWSRLEAGRSDDLHPAGAN